MVIDLHDVWYVGRSECEKIDPPIYWAVNCMPPRYRRR